MKKKLKVNITGGSKNGYVMALYSPADEFNWDVAVTKEELIAIREEINKKIK